MALPSLLFVTNLQNSDPEEDIFLADYLGAAFHVQLASPSEAVPLLPRIQRCLIRNAWPSRLFVEEFTQIERICVQQDVRTYNPLHRRGWLENKTYLVDLYEQGYPVIPSIDSKAEIDRLPQSETYIIKPKDSCSSFGVESLTKEDILHREFPNHIIQPEVDLRDEISFYFIDDVFEYATVSAGKDKRWELCEYSPTQQELDWAKIFVQWNKLPYGLQRIDAARQLSGELILMEVEDTTPMLTLSDITVPTKERVLQRFTRSLLKHLVFP